MLSRHGQRVVHVLEPAEQFADDARGQEVLDALGLVRMHVDRHAELRVAHGRRQALEGECPSRLGLGAEFVAVQDHPSVVERRDDPDVDTGLGRCLDGVDPGVGLRVLELLGRPDPIRDVASSLALEDDAPDTAGTDHVHEDVRRRVRRDDQGGHVLLESGIDAQTLHGEDLVLGARAFHDLDVRPRLGHGVPTGRVERVEVGFVALAHPRTVEHVPNAHVEHPDDAVAHECHRNAHGVRDLHRHVAAALVLRHLRADDEDRLLQGLLERHGQERAGLGERIGSVQHEERVVFLVGGRDHASHLDTIPMHDVGGVLSNRQVLQRHLDALGDSDPFKQLCRGLGRTEGLSHHPQGTPGVEHVNLHLRSLLIQSTTPPSRRPCDKTLGVFPNLSAH